MAEREYYLTWFHNLLDAVSECEKLLKTRQTLKFSEILEIASQHGIVPSDDILAHLKTFRDCTVDYFHQEITCR